MWIRLFLLLLMLGYFGYRCIDHEVVGFIHDDGVYAVLAKGFTEGDWSRLIHIPGDPYQAKYPLLYPWMISWVWFLFPNFPENILPLTLFTLFISLCGLAALAHHLKTIYRCTQWEALLITTLVGLNFYWLYYTTTLMSEGLYFLLSILTLFWAEKTLLNENEGKAAENHHWVMILILSVLSFHTRIIGICLLVSITISLLLKPKQHAWKLWYPLLGFLLTLLPWGLWSLWVPHLNDTLTTPLQTAHLLPYESYFREFIDTWQHGDPFAQLHLTGTQMLQALLDLWLPWITHYLDLYEGHTLRPNSPFHGIITTLQYLISAGFLIFSLRFLFQKKQLFRSPSILYILSSLLVILLWRYDGHIERFLIMLSPWFFLLLFRTLKQPTIILLVSCLILIPDIRECGKLMYTRSHHFWVETETRPQAQALWPSYQTSFQFIKEHTAPTSIIACGFNATTYLYTGRQTIPLRLSLINPSNETEAQRAVQQIHQALQSQPLQSAPNTFLLMEPELIAGQRILAKESLLSRYLLYRYPSSFGPPTLITPWTTLYPVQN